MEKVQPFMNKTLRCWQRNPSSFEDIFQLKTQSFQFLLSAGLMQTFEKKQKKTQQ